MQARVKLPPPALQPPSRRKRSLRERLGSHFRHHSGSASISGSLSPNSPRISSPESPGLGHVFRPNPHDDTVFYSLPPAFSLRTHPLKPLPLEGMNGNSSTSGHDASPPAKRSPQGHKSRRVAFNIELPSTILEDEVFDSPQCMTPRTPGAISLPPVSVSRPRTLLRSLSRQSSQMELPPYNPYDTTALRHFIEINFPDSVLLEEHQVCSRTNGGRNNSSTSLKKQKLCTVVNLH